MASEILNGVFLQTNLQESEEYLARREELRLAEIALMRQQEAVAEMRRHLPAGARLPDYVFQEGPENLASGDSPIRDVRLSRLFSGPGRALIVYHFMFGKRQVAPCPMCTALLDGLNALALHIRQTADLAVVSAADPVILRNHARNRGWNHLRLLSAGSGTFKSDLGSEDSEGRQDSSVSVFTLDQDGTPRHFYTAHPRMGPDIRERGLDLLSPIWNYLDLTPRGRGDFYAELQYPAKPLT